METLDIKWPKGIIKNLTGLSHEKGSGHISALYAVNHRDGAK